MFLPGIHVEIHFLVFVKVKLELPLHQQPYCFPSELAGMRFAQSTCEGHQQFFYKVLVYHLWSNTHHSLN